MDAVLTLARETDPALLKGRLILVPCVNLPAFFGRAIYVNPLDGKNLNRVFPGSLAGTASEVLAATVVRQVLEPCDHYIDLHGGDMIEALQSFAIWGRSGVAHVDRASEQMARVFGIQSIVEGEVGGSAMGAAARLGKPAILAESGGQGILDPAAAAVLLEGVRRVLRFLGMLPGSRPEPVVAPAVRMAWMRSNRRGMFYSTVAVGQRVAVGQKLGEIRDLYGQVQEELVSPAAGPILFLVTSLATSPGDPLLAVGQLA
jgi:hypothetical protein